VSGGRRRTIALSDQFLKSRLRDGEICKGTFLLFLAGGDVVQCLSGLGFDFLILSTVCAAAEIA